jgi:hypothetical protein
MSAVLALRRSPLGRHRMVSHSVFAAIVYSPKSPGKKSSPEMRINEPISTSQLTSCCIAPHASRKIEQAYYDSACPD